MLFACVSCDEKAKKPENDRLSHEILFEAELRRKDGASERIRTVDNHVGNVMLYQLSYTRIIDEPLFYIKKE